MRDFDVLSMVRDRIEATGEFAEALLGREPDTSPNPGGLRPSAWVRPLAWKEQSISDPECRTRTLDYSVAIKIDRERYPVPDTELDRLGNVAQDAVNNPILETLPAVSTIDRGVYPTTDVHPDATVILYGTAVYLLDGYQSRETSES